jgi:hypothetical protein
MQRQPAAIDPLLRNDCPEVHQTSVRRAFIDLRLVDEALLEVDSGSSMMLTIFFVGIRAEFHRFLGRDQARSRSIVA